MIDNTRRWFACNDLWPWCISSRWYDHDVVEKMVEYYASYCFSLLLSMILNRFLSYFGIHHCHEKVCCVWCCLSILVFQSTGKWTFCWKAIQANNKEKSKLPLLTLCEWNPLVDDWWIILKVDCNSESILMLWCLHGSVLISRPLKSLPYTPLPEGCGHSLAWWAPSWRQVAGNLPSPLAYWGNVDTLLHAVCILERYAAIR